MNTESYADGKVLVERQRQVYVGEINRLECRNGCVIETVQALHDAFQYFENDNAAKVGARSGIK